MEIKSKISLITPIIFWIGGIGNNEFGGDDGNDPELAMVYRKKYSSFF